MTSVIEIDSLTKTYGRILAVDSLELSIKKGELFGFLGPNGAGKTTTIKLMMGLIKPSKGRVMIKGREVQKDPRRAIDDIGYLPEDIDLYSNLTGRETLEFFAETRGVDRKEVSSLLGKVGLMDAADRKVGEYSKGMVQRLAFAQSLLGDPSLLILDEPTSGLDPQGTAIVKETVKAYIREGGTVFFSSHILPNVQEVADRVGIIVDGRLQALDSVESLREEMKIPSKMVLDLSENVEKVIGTLQSDKRVNDVQGKDRRLFVTCDSREKRAVMNLIEEQGVEIVNFTTKEGDLEDVFLQYMGGER